MPYQEYILNNYPKYYLPDFDVISVYERSREGLVDRQIIQVPEIDGQNQTVTGVAVFGQYLFVSSTTGSGSALRSRVIRYELENHTELHNPVTIATFTRQIKSICTNGNTLYILQLREGSATNESYLKGYHGIDTASPNQTTDSGPYLGSEAIACSDSKIFIARSSAGSRSNKVEVYNLRSSDGAPIRTSNDSILTGSGANFYTTIRGMTINGNILYLLNQNATSDPYEIRSYTLNLASPVTAVPIGGGNNNSPTNTIQGIDVDTEHIIDKGNASELAYVYNLRSRVGSGNTPEKELDIILKLKDGESASSQLIFECNVSAARGGGFPNLHSKLTHHDSIYYEFRDGSESDDAISSSTEAEWLIGLWTEP